MRGLLLLRGAADVIRTRQPYTDQEDLILVERISKPGVSLNGNKVYQELAAEVSWAGPAKGSDADD